MRVTTVEVPDVNAIRRALHMSQHRFEALYCILLSRLKNWEQKRRAPDAPTITCLRVIARPLKEVVEAEAG
jgi:DNA-binding transcriptional regulator YiaG